MTTTATNRVASDGGEDNPRTVSRGFNAQKRVNLSFDSLYLVVEYPHSDAFERWAAYLDDFSDPELYTGIPVEDDFVLKRGAHGYKLSVWNGDARVFLTDRVNDNLAGTPAEGKGMGVLLQLGPKWLHQFGPALSETRLRNNIAGQLEWFGVRNPLSYPIRLNRMDIALDLLGLDITSFNIEDWRQGWVGRARIGNFHFDKRTGDLTGFDIGGHDAQVRMVAYNKALEAAQKGNLRFWRSVWGLGPDGDDDIQVTRFEWAFRCYKGRFAALRYLDGYTFEYFLGLLNYATQFWGMLRIPGESERNKQRWELHPQWEEILAHIADYSLNYTELARPHYELRPDINPAYLQSLSGWLAGFQARVGLEQGEGDAASLARALSYLHEQGHTFDDIAERAGEKYEVFARLSGGQHG